MAWIKVLLNLYMMKSLLMHILSSSKHVLGFLDYIIILECASKRIFIKYTWVWSRSLHIPHHCIFMIVILLIIVIFSTIFIIVMFLITAYSPLSYSSPYSLLSYSSSLYTHHCYIPHHIPHCHNHHCHIPHCLISTASGALVVVPVSDICSSSSI